MMGGRALFLYLFCYYFGYIFYSYSIGMSKGFLAHRAGCGYEVGVGGKQVSQGGIPDGRLLITIDRRVAQIETTAEAFGPFFLCGKERGGSSHNMAWLFIHTASAPQLTWVVVGDSLSAWLYLDLASLNQHVDILGMV